MWIEGRHEGVVGGCVREVAIAGAVRSQPYQDAPERLCGIALKLLLLRTILFFIESLKVMN